MVNVKQKGTTAERELMRMFWEKGFACVRAAGSGSTPLPSPDLLVGNKLRFFAIECKATKATKVYLTEKEVNELQTFAERFGAEPWVGVKFTHVDWYFLTLEDLVKTEKSYVVALLQAKRKGLSFEELVSQD